MISDPNLSRFPTPDEIRAIKRQAEQDRARIIRGAIRRMTRTITAAIQRPDRDAHLPSGAVGAQH